MKSQTIIIIIIVILISSLSPVQAQDAVGDLLGRINGLRTDLGREPYSLNGALSTAARNHAQWMASGGGVSHVQDNGSTVRDRAQAAGYGSSWVSENIYMGGLAGVDSAWNFWLNSPIHYRGMTSANYSHIGIATAAGERGQAFVLVFGNPGGSYSAARSGGNSSGGNEAPQSQGPPPFFLGVDAVGNLKHEIQPGDTLGDIALYYGYTWDDIPQILTLNEMTDTDIRTLKEGDVLLVPPKNGTYTPTPPPQPEQTQDAQPQQTQTAQPTATPTVSDQDAGMIGTPAATTPPPPAPETTAENNSLLPPAQYNTENPPTAAPPTSTPVVNAAAPQTPLPSAVAAVTVTPLAVAANPTMSSPTPVTASTMSTTPTPPLWLIAAIMVQLGVLGYASVEFVRRWRRDD